MTTKVVPGMLIAVPDRAQVPPEAANRIAKFILEAIETHGRATLALSGGSTPFPAYTLLAQDPRFGAEVWGKIDIFFVDDRAVPPDHARSNFRQAKEAFFDRAPIPVERIHRMRGEAEDLAAAARDYAREIETHVRKSASGVPEFDVAIFGVGDDGHTASLFPGEPTIDVTDRLVVDVPASGKREARLSIAAPVIEHVRAAIIIAVGNEKRDALERIWSTSGDIHHTPARLLRGVRGSITWIIDKAAGGLG